MRDRRRLLMVIGATVMLAALPCLASFPGTELFIPSVGRGPGSLGSRWYTTVWLHNPGSTAADATLSLLLRDQGNPRPVEQVLRVPAGATIRLADALADLYDIDTAMGALRIRSTAPVVAGARVFNQPGASIADSQGQLMTAMPASLAVGPGESTDVPGLTQPADGSFRCNFGLVETSGATARVEVALLDGNGVELASEVYTLAPYAAFQRPLTSLAPGVTLSSGRLHVTVVGGEGSVLAYASVAGNGSVSQDPTTLEMNEDAAALSGDGGERIEVPITSAVTTTAAGTWSVGGDALELPAAGRWRVGYRVMAQVLNYSYSTTSDPVSVTLLSLTDQQALVRDSMSVMGVQVNLSPSNKATLTVTGEAVITVQRATTLAIAGRSSNSGVQLIILPHDADVSPGLPPPDGASFLYAERLGD